MACPRVRRAGWRGVPLCLASSVTTLVSGLEIPKAGHTPADQPRPARLSASADILLDRHPQIVGIAIYRITSAPSLRSLPWSRGSWCAMKAQETVRKPIDRHGRQEAGAVPTVSARGRHLSFAHLGMIDRICLRPQPAWHRHNRVEHGYSCSTFSALRSKN